MLCDELLDKLERLIGGRPNLMWGCDEETGQNKDNKGSLHGGALDKRKKRRCSKSKISCSLNGNPSDGRNESMTNCESLECEVNSQAEKQCQESEGSVLRRPIQPRLNHQSRSIDSASRSAATLVPVGCR